ncbi:isocitrate lyase/phosphoenolpyruvate mutase family protein [Tabrizicola sp. BL-A-41-H6]|uniref:isocitrate lyase/phosphoenolpyruvate mutase family protein n=1 Tax=Tabrizicola sp. BL-A-41-H6 TaxID=3421107 RepID=UPI003D67184B
MTLAARHQGFHDLHQTGCFVIPHPWDRGSARMMAAVGVQALATSSAAQAFTLGRPDFGGVIVAELAAMGVRRISTGSQIARLTHAAIRDSVGAMLGQGSFALLSATASGAEIDDLLTFGSNAQ